MEAKIRYGVMGGERYVARDTSGRADHRCEHATWDEETQEVIWANHPQGGMMEPFLGPDDVYERITAGGLHMWDPADARR